MSFRIVRYCLIAFFSASAGIDAAAQNDDLQLLFNEPAGQWEETLPLGNGRLGMTPDGGVVNEKIVLNEITLWSGGPQDANNYEAASFLPEIRSLLAQGRNHEAQALVNKNFVCKGEGSGHGNGANVPFGCYQTLGELNLRFEYEDVVSPKPDGYTRRLSLNDAVASCTFEVDGVRYSRTYLTSFSDDIALVKLQANRKGKVNVTLSLSRPERSVTTVDGEALVMSGQLNNGTDGKGMSYLVKVKPLLKGGEIIAEGNELRIRNANEVILHISAATDFRNVDYSKKVDDLLKAGAKKSFERQVTEHTRNYRRLFDRVSFNLGSRQLSLPTDERLYRFSKDPQSDRELPVLFFQFGRYLAISSTRVGLLPPNLQGLWAKEIQTPWNGDYHLDVNVQMNHWPLAVTNLSELNLPLADLVGSMVESGERTAKAYYNAEGWVAHVITNIWGYTEPGEDASWGVANAGSGWLCNNLWQHYEFTNDEAYLKTIYPILKGSAKFYRSVLVEDPKTKWLVTAPSVSPENAFYTPDGKYANVCMGPTIDHQITRELFTNVIAASEKLGLDPEFRDELKRIIRKLPPAGRIGGDGRLLEWLDDYKEADPKHRHISHLYGLYPASLITPDATPELAQACIKTLDTRGDDSPGWSKAYKLLFWARLHDGDRAYRLLRELLQPTKDTHINYGAGGGTYPNLFSAGPPFQIDGNFGGTAGIAEMLIQSHAGYIHLLPAIPEAWKKSGDVKGLRARGNFTIDMKWKDGKVLDYRICSISPRTVKVKVNGEIKEISAQKL